MAEPSNSSITLVVDLPVARDRVWAAWTTGRVLTTWLCDSAHVVPIIGGTFDLFWTHREPEPDRGGSSLGQVLFVDPPRLLSFTSTGHPETTRGESRAGWSGETTVTVTLFPTPGGTRLEIVHGGWPEAPEAREVRRWAERRWAAGIERLLAALDAPRSS